MENNKKYNISHCSDCEFLKVYNYVHKCFYCDNEKRIDDIGKLGVNLPELRSN